MEPSLLLKMLGCFCSLRQRVREVLISATWSCQSASLANATCSPEQGRAPCQGWPVTPLPRGTPELSTPSNTPTSQQAGVVISSSRIGNPVLSCWSQGNDNICVRPTHHTEEPHSVLDVPAQPSSTAQLLMLPSWDKAQQWVNPTHLLFWHCLSSLPYRAQKIYVSVTEKHSRKLPSEKFPQ